MERLIVVILRASQIAGCSPLVAAAALVCYWRESPWWTPLAVVSLIGMTLCWSLQVLVEILQAFENRRRRRAREKRGG